MKLYGFILSPFVQRVLIAARIKGHELALERPPGGTIQAEAFAAISPMRRIPVLEEDDGWTLAESAPIVAYLDEALPGPALLPDDPRDRGRARMVAGLVDTEFAAGLRHFVVQKLFRACDEPAQLAYGRTQLNAGLDAIVRIGLDARWAVGDAPTIADAALIPFLALADMLGEFAAAQPIEPGRRDLDAYRARMLAEPLGKRTFEEMRNGFLALRARQEQQA